jgi:hypothetical protein
MPAGHEATPCGEGEQDKEVPGGSLTVDIDVDVLTQWWKQNAGKYPCLGGAKALHENTLPFPRPVHQPSACSRVGADLIATKKQGSLHNNVIEAYMCLKSWL